MLDKRSRNILIALGMLILIIVVTEISRPRPIDWRPSYTSVETAPLGSSVLFEELEGLMTNIPIEQVVTDPYEFLLNENHGSNSSYIFINNNLNFDKRQLEKLQEYVANGNSVFASAHYFGSNVLDSLNIDTNINYEILETELNSKFFSSEIHLDSLATYRDYTNEVIFESIDTTATSALGYFENETERTENLNFIKVAHGDGFFYFHTLPEAFSNYYLLEGRQQYAASVLSYIKSDKIYWDDYLKSGRKVVTSPMRFVFSQKALTWAYYVLAGGLLLFVLIKAKREQRIIEVREPLKNTSIEFTQTIGDLYYQHKDFSNLIRKKIKFFLESVRSRFFLNTENLDNAFTEKLAIKSGNSLEETKKLIDYMNHLRQKSFHSEEDVIELNKKLEEF